MPKNSDVTPQDFDALMKWLDRNRDEAGLKYEKIRTRIIKVLYSRGCYEAEQLADETINRVTAKLSTIIDTYTGEPALYFYGVANHVHREWLRVEQKRVQELPQESDIYREREPEYGYECLEKCLGELPEPERQIITEYYTKEKTAKIENRKALAEKLGITVNALQIKSSRIRHGLKKCIQGCLTGK
jgi:RNA polymerase sigma factor (sigma-70 family)